MWSASSSTVISTASRSQWPWPMRSSSRPGQATTMSTPLRRAVDLRVLADAAEDGGGGQPGGLGQRLEGLVDLADQLAGRREDEGARATAGRGHLARVEPGDHGEHEGVGLARSGAAAAEHVAPGERVRQRRCLDRGGVGDATVGQHGRQGSGDAEGVEGGGHRRSLGWCLTNASAGWRGLRRCRCVITCRDGAPWRSAVRGKTGRTVGTSVGARRSSDRISDDVPLVTSPRRTRTA